MQHAVNGEVIPGWYKDLSYVLTHRPLPAECANEEDARLLLRLARKKSGRFKDIGIYMFQMTSLDFEVVRCLPCTCTIWPCQRALPQRHSCAHRSLEYLPDAFCTCA